jgi:rhamnosyltransferase
MLSQSISVVIRVRNEAAALATTLKALSSQTVRPKEVIVVDNESTDDSRKVSEDAGANVIVISRQEFTYGRSLNVGIEASTGDYVLLLSAHSIPISRYFVQEVLESFGDDRVAAVTCRRTGTSDKCLDWLHRPQMTRADGWNRCGLESCGSAIRRSVWQEFPYHEGLEAAEDLVWCRDVLDCGYSIRHSGAAYLYDGPETFSQTIRRSRRVLTALYRIDQKRAVGYSGLGSLKQLIWRIPKQSIRQWLLYASEVAFWLVSPIMAGRIPRVGSNR